MNLYGQEMDEAFLRLTANMGWTIAGSPPIVTSSAREALEMQREKGTETAGWPGDDREGVLRAVVLLGPRLPIATVIEKKALSPAAPSRRR